MFSIGFARLFFMHRRFLLLSPFFLFLASCSGQIKGTVFLDGNGNGNLESNEKAIKNVSVSVTYNGTEIGKAETDAQGQFSIPSKGPGYYCVQTEEQGLTDTLMSQVVSGSISASALTPPNSVPSIATLPPAGKSMAAKDTATPNPQATTPVCGNGIQETGEECDDHNTTSGDSCSNQCKKETPSNPAPATPPPPTNPERKESGIVCKNSDGFSLTVQVPVQLSYQAETSLIPPPLKQVRKVGESFSIGIPTLGCKLKTLYVPDGLTVSPNAVIHVDPNVNKIDFNPSFSGSSVVLELKVKDDIPLGTTSVQISPQVLCPNGQTVALNPISIDLKSTPTMDISQSIPDADCHLGGLLHWKITVHNTGTKIFDGVKVVATRPDNTDPVIADARCSLQSGGEYDCSLGTLNASASPSPMEIQVKLPDSVEVTTDFVFHASIKSSDFTDAINADERKCTLTH